MFMAKVHILLTKTRQVILVLTVNPTPWLTPTLDYHFVRIDHVSTTLSFLSHCDNKERVVDGEQSIY